MTMACIGLLALAFCSGAHAACTAVTNTWALTCPALEEPKTSVDKDRCTTKAECDEKCCQVFTDTTGTCLKDDSASPSTLGSLIKGDFSGKHAAAESYVCFASLFEDKTGRSPGDACTTGAECVGNCCQVFTDATGTCVLDSSASTPTLGSKIKADGTGKFSAAASYTCPSTLEAKTGLTGEACKTKVECNENCCQVFVDAAGTCAKASGALGSKIKSDGSGKLSVAATYTCPANKLEDKTGRSDSDACKTKAECDENCCQVFTNVAGTCDKAGTSPGSSIKSSGLGKFSAAETYTCLAGSLEAKTGRSPSDGCTTKAACDANCCQIFTDPAGTCVKGTSPGSLIKPDGTGKLAAAATYACPASTPASMEGKTPVSDATVLRCGTYACPKDPVANSECPNEADCKSNCCQQNADAGGTCGSSKIKKDGNKLDVRGAYACPSPSVDKDGASAEACQTVTECDASCCETTTTTTISISTTINASNITITTTSRSPLSALVSKCVPPRSLWVMHLIVLGGAIVL